MANLLTIKRRIRTAQNVSKTTKAMQMIAASKLKRAEDAALSARPYVDKLTNLTTGISQKTEEEEKTNYQKKLVLNQSRLIVFISPDKGLCGGLITNLAREIFRFNREFKNTSYITVGKKAESIISYMKGEIIASFDFGTIIPSYDMVFPIMSLIDDYFLNKKVSEVYALNSYFLSVFSQTPNVKKLLPVELATENGKKENKSLFEPEAKILLPGLLRHYLETGLYQSLLESFLSEQAARMLAMQNATDNAKDIIEELKLLYNKTRQEKITSEILDIAGGAFAYE